MKKYTELHGPVNLVLAGQVKQYSCFYSYQFEKHIFSKDWGSRVETAAYEIKITVFLIMTVTF